MNPLRSKLSGLLSLLAVTTFARGDELHTFKRIQINDQFWSEGANFADLNNDGVNDLISGHAGEYWVGSYEALGGAATGTLTSISFAVTQSYASFLVGGGSGIQTRVGILNSASGQVLFRATGPDNERMRRVFVDLRPFMGAKIQVRLVDEATTGWGHLNFDDFVFHDNQPAQALEVKPSM